MLGRVKPIRRRPSFCARSVECGTEASHAGVPITSAQEHAADVKRIAGRRQAGYESGDNE